MTVAFIYCHFFIQIFNLSSIIIMVLNNINIISGGVPMRILLVEDEKRMAEALCEILRLEKYEVDHFSNGILS